MHATLKANWSARERTNFPEVAVAGIMRGPQLARLLGDWHVRTHRRGPEYAALAAAVRGLLHDGRLALGVRLPAERELADSLGISRTTVTAAYRTLRESGHLTSRRGAGSWTELPGGHRIGSGGLLMSVDDDDALDLNCATLPAPPQTMAAVTAAAAELPPYLARRGYQPTGIDPLREVVAARFTARGVPTDPEQIMITSGVQQALDLLVRLFAAPGQRVLVEAPTYPNALTALAERRHRVLTYNLGRERLGRRPHALDAARRVGAAGVPDPGLPQPHRSPDAGGVAGPAARRGAQRRHRTRHRRVVRRPAPGRRREPAAGGRLRPGRPHDHHRRHEQAVLGWPAHRLDPGRRADHRPARRAAGARRHGLAGAGAA